MTLVGNADQGPREVVWYLAKVIPDPARNEPVNIGLILRVAESEELTYRFDEPRSWSRESNEWRDYVSTWVGQMQKYGPKCLRWLPRRKVSDRFYIDLAGNNLKPGRVDFDAMYQELVAPRMEYFPKIVHRLRHGQAVCMFSEEVPGRWPEGHVWAPEDKLHKVNCRPCAEAGEVVSRETPATARVESAGLPDIVLPDPAPVPPQETRPVGSDGVLHTDIVIRRDDLLTMIEECETMKLASGGSRRSKGKDLCQPCLDRTFLIEELELMLPKELRR